MKAISKRKKGGLAARAKSVKTKKVTGKRKVIAGSQQVREKFVDSDLNREIPWRPHYKSKAADEEG